MTTEIPSVGRVMGLDWGATRIGVALTDPIQLIATPHVVWRRRRGRRLPLGAFLTLVESREPVGLVVGVPYDDDGQLGDSARAAREMGERFAEQSGLPLEWLDESFSTSETLDRLTARGVAPRSRQDELDAMAAAIVLERWISNRRGPP